MLTYETASNAVSPGIEPGHRKVILNATLAKNCVGQLTSDSNQRQNPSRFKQVISNKTLQMNYMSNPIKLLWLFRITLFYCVQLSHG